MKEYSKLPSTVIGGRGLPGSGDGSNGKKQMIKLPVAVDENAPDKDNLNIIRNEEIKSVAKRRKKLGESLMKGFAMVSSVQEK
jgi:hypothetical protein